MQRPSRTAVVTGGSRGLGRALTEELARRGWRVYATGRDSDALDELEDALDDCDVVGVRGDVASVRDNAALVERVHADGALVDAVVHNAGLLGPPRTPLAHYPPDEFQRVMSANVFGPYDLTRQLLPYLAPAAALIFVSSGVSLAPRSGWGAYNVSKIALDGLAGIFARELRELGHRVFIVDPGAMRTDMRAAAYPDEDPETVTPPEQVASGVMQLIERGRLEDSGTRVELP